MVTHWARVIFLSTGKALSSLFLLSALIWFSSHLSLLLSVFTSLFPPLLTHSIPLFLRPCAVVGGGGRQRERGGRWNWKQPESEGNEPNKSNSCPCLLPARTCCLPHQRSAATCTLHWHQLHCLCRRLVVFLHLNKSVAGLWCIGLHVMTLGVENQVFWVGFWIKMYSVAFLWYICLETKEKV